MFYKIAHKPQLYGQATIPGTTDIARSVIKLREHFHSEGTYIVVSPITFHYQVCVSCEHSANIISVVLFKLGCGFQQNFDEFIFTEFSTKRILCFSLRCSLQMHAFNFLCSGGEGKKKK